MSIADWNSFICNVVVQMMLQLFLSQNMPIHPRLMWLLNFSVLNRVNYEVKRVPQWTCTTPVSKTLPIWSSQCLVECQCHFTVRTSSSVQQWHIHLRACVSEALGHFEHKLYMMNTWQSDLFYCFSGYLHVGNWCVRVLLFKLLLSQKLHVIFYWNMYSLC